MAPRRALETRVKITAKTSANSPHVRNTVLSLASDGHHWTDQRWAAAVRTARTAPVATSRWNQLLPYSGGRRPSQA